MTSYLKQAREWAYPTLKTSAFLERGVLTPEEFVKAGDELVYRCPTWSWESGQKIRSYLPADKQFLVTRNVPCRHRCSEVEDSGFVLEEEHIELMRNALLDNSEGGGGDDGEEEGWMVSKQVDRKKVTSSSLEDEFDVIDSEGETLVQLDRGEEDGGVNDSDGKGNVVPDQEEEYADMTEFEEDNILTETDEAMMELNIDDKDDDNIIKVRSYDVSISYDKYYQTPRVWLFGYDEDGNPLEAEQMFEDCMSDYVKRTVTLESHPHTSGIYASIHPCQHGAVMKNIVRNISKKGNVPSVENYLFIFLKFVSSIIPTINYDFTMEVEASTKT
mmetsp:Transcript_2066/g.2760  ORF Transcript_2066/g.2760 Transcript_2066/m.2760 type:complete len:330 (-) Transcript_2066:66-1055(-)|eukprot:CAMPEP_0116074548 /NCGR_PEP_ID=MMETSP0322-20121206/16044_1 /TAXON_ID=163516 /ORGANISM="Leptocylindrus danicus var. apora, Strain B651" /LENGTH=329 /DNA_ID=CAMNT_0003564315 /DNA_START=20 /DNA_END=1009 /DNA_ORIENTATION=-